MEFNKNGYIIQSDKPIGDEDDFIAIYGDGYQQLMKNKKDSFGRYSNWNGFTNCNNGEQTYHRIAFIAKN